MFKLDLKSAPALSGRPWAAGKQGLAHKRIVTVEDGLLPMLVSR